MIIFFCINFFVTLCFIDQKVTKTNTNKSIHYQKHIVWTAHLAFFSEKILILNFYYLIIPLTNYKQTLYKPITNYKKISDKS